MWTSAVLICPRLFYKIKCQHKNKCVLTFLPLYSTDQCIFWLTGCDRSTNLLNSYNCHKLWNKLFDYPFSNQPTLEQVQSVLSSCLSWGFFGVLKCIEQEYWFCSTSFRWNTKDSVKHKAMTSKPIQPASVLCVVPSEVIWQPVKNVTIWIFLLLDSCCCVW